MYEVLTARPWHRHQRVMRDGTMLNMEYIKHTLQPGFQHSKGGQRDTNDDKRVCNYICFHVSNYGFTNWRLSALFKALWFFILSSFTSLFEMNHL